MFPCEPGGKRPLIKDWPNAATTDARKISLWWNRWPEANLATPTGRENGFFALDVDNFTSLEILEEEHG